MPDIFVSYTSSDRKWAFWIGRELERLGHTPHIHEKEIPAGGDIHAWMEERLGGADQVVCVISRAYLDAPYSSWERRAAQWAANKRPNFVFPVFVEDCEPPILMAHIRRCALFGLSEDDARKTLADYLTPTDLAGSARFPGRADGARAPPPDLDTVSFPGGSTAATVAISPAPGPSRERIASVRRRKPADEQFAGPNVYEGRPLRFPAPRGGTEPVLTLAQVLGRNGDAMVKRICDAGRLVFHAVGDTGSTRDTYGQLRVANTMVADFDEETPEERPQFFFHLGNVVYDFGEREHYYSQFYEPYRDYPAPILALAGNHDGMVAPGVTEPPLAAFLGNFCAVGPEVRQEAGVPSRAAQPDVLFGLPRTAQLQPGVFFTFEAPMLRILALYSNVLEGGGVIAAPGIGDSQLDFLRAALTRAMSFDGALILAHHHPAYTFGPAHGLSVGTLAQIDAICAETGVWPHAVLSAHANNYQRFTRVHQSMTIPYIVAGNGGHAVTELKRSLDAGEPVPTPAGYVVRREAYDDQNFGYLRVVVTKTELRIEYHPASDGSGAKSPRDVVVVHLANRKLALFR